MEVLGWMIGGTLTVAMLEEGFFGVTVFIVDDDFTGASAMTPVDVGPMNVVLVEVMLTGAGIFFEGATFVCKLSANPIDATMAKMPSSPINTGSRIAPRRLMDVIYFIYPIFSFILQFCFQNICVGAYLIL